jgi:lipase
VSGGSRLHLHAWGPPDAPRVVCLHGVTSWGGHFHRLAEAALPGHRVLAPDLLGHGSSPPDPPWSLRAQLDAVVATVGEEPATWIGHSLGGRLAFELAAVRPELVERLVLLDPAILLAPGSALLPFAEDARTRRTFPSFDALVDARFEASLLTSAPRELVAAELAHHTTRGADGRWEYRYVQAMAVTTYSELAAPPPPFDAVRAPTLLVVGETTYLPLDDVAAGLRKALGERFEQVTVPGGHTVLWDALPETAAAVSAFLGR